MDFTDEQLGLLFQAWVLGREGLGMVITDDAYPMADQLAEHGWLERRFVEDGEMGWFWGQRAEVALDVNALMDSGVRGREN